MNGDKHAILMCSTESTNKDWGVQVLRVFFFLKILQIYLHYSYITDLMCLAMQ